VRFQCKFSRKDEAQSQSDREKRRKREPVTLRMRKREEGGLQKKERGASALLRNQAKKVKSIANRATETGLSNTALWPDGPKIAKFRHFTLDSISWLPFKLSRNRTRTPNCRYYAKGFLVFCGLCDAITRRDATPNTVKFFLSALSNPQLSAGRFSGGRRDFRNSSLGGFCENETAH